MLQQSLLEIANQYEAAAAFGPPANTTSQALPTQQLASTPMSQRDPLPMHHTPVASALPCPNSAVLVPASASPAGPSANAPAPQVVAGAHGTLGMHAAPQMLGQPTMDRDVPMMVAASAPAAVNPKAWPSHVWYTGQGVTHLNTYRAWVMHRDHVVITILLLHMPTCLCAKCCEGE
jgi:hypothetical protein